MAKETQVQTNEEAEKKHVDELVARVAAAQKKYAEYTQEQVDHIFRRVALKLSSLRIPLAKMAVEETGMGVVEDKVIKNHFASEYIYNKFKNTKTCGILEEDKANGLIKIAEPLGVIAGVIPTTNPTSTAIFKSLIALKTRNGIIFSPHPRAKKCTVETARIILEEAVKAGAPEDIIGWIENPTIFQTQYLMQHPQIDIILATGGPGMVKSAYSSGKPALGVGAGNTPALIDETADIQMAVSSILMSKTFDNGMICASEQSVMAGKDVYDAVKAEFVKRGAYILTPKEKEKLAKVIMIDGHLNAAIVGQPAYKIAEMAKISVPEETKVLIAECTKVGAEEPFSAEKLSPVLAMYKADDFKSGADLAKALVSHGGKGHTSVLYTNPQNDDRIKYFGHLMITGRVMINCPSSQGAIGDIYNFRLEPSLTLGCGSWGGNSVSENVGVKHLMNIKNVVKREENMLWFRIPPKVYFKPGSLSFALKELKGKKRAFIVTDKPLFDLGYTKKVTDVLDEIGVAYKIFSDVHPDPDLTTVNMAIGTLRSFEPDVIIALGGGSPMDCAKGAAARVVCPNKTVQKMRGQLKIRKKLPPFFAVPTTAGTGSETTLAAVVTDTKTHEKYALNDPVLRPKYAVLDPELTVGLPPHITSTTGMDALTHAVEAYIGHSNTKDTSEKAEVATKLIFENLEEAYKNGKDLHAREQMLLASHYAGIAFTRAYVGNVHAIAHNLGGFYGVPHGLANAIILPYVLDFYGETAYERLARLCECAGVAKAGQTDEQKALDFIQAIRDMNARMNIPDKIDKIQEKDIETIAKRACKEANPLYPVPRIMDLDDCIAIIHRLMP